MRFFSMIRTEETDQTPSPRLMEEMGRLMEEMTRKGHLIQTAGLRPTHEGVRIRSNRGRLSRVDGPFTETKEVIGGYAILEADSMDEALELTRRFLAVHGDEWNLECEVRALHTGECGPEAHADGSGAEEVEDAEPALTPPAS